MALPLKNNEIVTEGQYGPLLRITGHIKVPMKHIVGTYST